MQRVRAEALAAGFRKPGEAVVYPVWLGTRDTPVMVNRRGVRAEVVERRVAEALRRFEEDTARIRALSDARRLDTRVIVEAAVRLNVRLLRIHPFIDGNGRTATVLFVYAMVRGGLPLVQTEPTPLTRWALGMALRVDGRHSYKYLVDLLCARILQP